MSRGNCLKLSKPTVHLDLRKHFFAVRVIDYWNSLTNHEVTAGGINDFKTRLDKFLKSKGHV